MAIPETPLEKAVREAVLARADWLEDVLAGLLSNGVAKERIQVLEYPYCLVTEVRVDGVVKYEYQVKVPNVDRATLVMLRVGLL